MVSNCPNCRGFVVTAVLVLAAAPALGVDMVLARALQAARHSETVHGWLGLFDMFEMFGQPLGAVVILAALYQLDHGRRWAIPRIVACALAAGGFADVLKMFILRTRPYECTTLSGAVWTTFGPWFPIFDAGSPGQSFPSAHTATAVGLAAALTWLYPQGRLLFALLAVLVGCQRIVCGAHYTSDVLIGAAAGCLMAQFFLHVGPIPKWFNQWEERWRRSDVPGDIPRSRN